jgi:hypothetical protein
VRGSTRRGDRWLDITAANPQEESQDTIRRLREISLGLRGGIGLYAFDRAVFEMGGEIYERDPEHAHEIEIPEDEVIARTAWRVLDEFAIFFEWIRNSLRNILLDVDKCVSQRNLMHSDAFWRRFISAAVGAKKQETQLWTLRRP